MLPLATLAAFGAKQLTSNEQINLGLSLLCIVIFASYMVSSHTALGKIASSIDLLKVVPGESIYYIRKNKYRNWKDAETASLHVDRDTIVSAYQNAARDYWRYCLRWNLISFVVFSPLYQVYRAAITSPKWMPVTVRSVGTFCVTLVRLVHNQRRVTCAAWVIVGTAVTATLLVEPGMNPVGKLLVVATNGSLCALLGIADYELVKRFKPEWLPANGAA
jgi:hypothetical protein